MLSSKFYPFTVTTPRLLVVRATKGIEQRSPRCLRVLPDDRRLGVILGGTVRAVEASESGTWAILFEVRSTECWPVSQCPKALAEDLSRLWSIGEFYRICEDVARRAGLSREGSSAGTAH